MGFSASMFTDVNMNDARVAVKLWARTVRDANHITADAIPVITKSPEETIRGLSAHQIEAIGMTTDEFFKVSQEVSFSHIFFVTLNGDATDSYVVVVRTDNPAQSLADLQGSPLLLFENPRACLALPWLEQELAAAGLPSSAQHFGRIQPTPKVARVILPVFFGKSPACIVTQRGFETMAELNPQIARQLKIIATSPPVVPTVFGIRESYQSPEFPEILDALLNLDKSPAGQQILLIFQCDGVRLSSLEELESSLRYLQPSPVRAGAALTNPAAN